MLFVPQRFRGTRAVLVLTTEISHDLIHENLGNLGSIVYVGSCRIYVIICSTRWAELVCSFGHALLELLC